MMDRRKPLEVMVRSMAAIATRYVLNIQTIDFAFLLPGGIVTMLASLFSVPVGSFDCSRIKVARTSRIGAFCRFRV